MIKLLDILNETIEKKGLIAIRDWVVEDYNSSGAGYNPSVNIENLKRALINYYYSKGEIYRLISVPFDIEDVHTYIWEKGKNKYSSFSDNLNSLKYFEPYAEADDEKLVTISQVSSYYSIDDWYRHHFDELQEIYENNPSEYYWIDEHLCEVENTSECIAMLDKNFKIIKIK